jgi:WD40 repeat protein
MVVDAVRLYDLDGGTPVLFRGPTNTITRIAFSNDSRRLLASSKDGSVTIWNIADPEERPVVLKHSEHVTHAELSPDGTRVLTVSQGSAELDWRNVRVWSADGSGEPTLLPSASAKWAAFSHDGESVVTVGSDVRLISLDWRRIARDLRARTTACLTIQQRIELLAESEAEARARFAICERTYDRDPANDMIAGCTTE